MRRAAVIPRRTAPYYRRKPWYRRITFFAVAQVAIILTIFAVGVGIVVTAVESSKEKDNSNTDPRVGWVVVNEDLEKKCDGSTMIYHDTWDGAYHVAANAPECVG